MIPSQFADLYSWFDQYVMPFLNTDHEGAKNIQLKIEHTRKVCSAMAQLCAGEKLSENESLIAATVALLHDIGRFTQYRRWRTFRDSESENHACLAVDIIGKEHILAGIAPSEQLLIIEAVRFHNMLKPPDQMQSPTRLYINLIRDADKLDIWRVFAEQLILSPDQRASAATLGLVDNPDEVSAACLTMLNSGMIINLDTVTCVNDFKLLLISWVYDLTCDTSRRLIYESSHLQTLAATLPERADITETVNKAVNSLNDFRLDILPAS